MSFDETRRWYDGYNLRGISIYNPRSVVMSGEEIAIDTKTFSNDMVTFNSKDDVLTLLIHLGYLTYNFETKKVSIPNYEITEQFASIVRIIGWSEISD